MTGAIEMLLDEHRLIERVLASMESFVERIDEPSRDERAAVREYTDFFHSYVDICHHGKEENYLFVRMGSYGFAKELGPVSAMLSEQDEGRDHLDALVAVGQGSGALSPHERELVKGHALAYVLRIRAHLKREDDILFPMACHALPPFVLDELAAEFRKFDRENLADGFHDRIPALAQKLISAYPPRSEVR